MISRTSRGSACAPAASFDACEADGIAITHSGKLFLAPRLEPLSTDTVPGQALHVWSLVAGLTMVQLVIVLKLIGQSLAGRKAT